MICAVRDDEGTTMFCANQIDIDMVFLFELSISTTFLFSCSEEVKIMKKGIRILSLLMSLILVLGIITAAPFTVSAAEAEASSTGATSGTTGDCT